MPGHDELNNHWNGGGYGDGLSISFAAPAVADEGDCYYVRRRVFIPQVGMVTKRQMICNSLLAAGQANAAGCDGSIQQTRNGRTIQCYYLPTVSNGHCIGLQSRSITAPTTTTVDTVATIPAVPPSAILTWCPPRVTPNNRDGIRQN